VPRISLHVFQMRNKAWSEYGVDRAVSANLVGDEEITTLRVFCRWHMAEFPKRSYLIAYALDFGRSTDLG
jgi:hypothetical protein